MDRQRILAEVQRTAAANDGRPLGYRSFEKATGITPHAWSHYWARWGDTLSEAGFEPNLPHASYTHSFVAASIVDLTRRLGRYPTWRDWSIERRSNATFPSVETVRRFGGTDAVRTIVVEYCRGREDCTDVWQLIQDSVSVGARSPVETLTDSGFVYLIKSGHQYKIGKTKRLGQRSRQFAIQLPHPHVVIHKIDTDDITGIESYWHRRFADKRLGTSEWFALSAADVRAFQKRRKSM